MNKRACTLWALAIAFASASAFAAEQYVYIANYGSSSITSFKVSPSGALSLVQLSVPTGTSPHGLAVNPTGERLYAATAVGGDVSAYKIEESGALTALGPPFPVGPRAFSVAVDATSRFLYVGLEGQARISIFRLNQNGSLAAQIGSVATLEAPRAVTVTRDGKYLYVANSNGASIGGYRIGQDGLLTPISNTPAGDHPFYIALDPLGKFLYSVDYTAMRVFAFAIGADGRLTQMGLPMPCGQYPGFAAVNPQGNMLYVGSSDGRVFVYAINTDGSLAPEVSPGLQPRYFLEPSAMVFHWGGPYAYLADRGANDVVWANVAQTGELQPVRGYVTGATPMAMATNSCTPVPKICELTADPSVLWPPNHAMVRVAIPYEVESLCGPASCTLTVSSNQAPAADSHEPDWVILGDHELLLRAERDPGLGEREYAITVTCRDSRGNAGSAVTGVTAPDNQGRSGARGRSNTIQGR